VAALADRRPGPVAGVRRLVQAAAASHHGRVSSPATSYAVRLAVIGAILATPAWLPPVVRAAEAIRGRRSTNPAGPPIERLAADLRRLRPLVDDAARSRTQREGARLAYEDVLTDACRALGIEHRLGATRGLAGEVEVLRVEAALADAGLRIGASRQ